MGRIRNRKELRAAYDASERRQGDEDKEPTDDAEEEEEDEDEETPASSDEDGEDEDEEEVAEVAEVKPKKRKAPAKPRTRTVKVTRMRVLWGVFDNAHKCVATYEYPRRGDADDHAARLTADKKNPHFVQPIKEPIEEKK